MSNTLLRIYPSELKIPFEVKMQRSCCMQLTNRTDQYVAFKVKTTNPKKYSVRHAFGVLLPRSSCSIRVTMQAPMEAPPDYHCKDKFLVQSVVVRDVATTKQQQLVPQLFTKAPGRVIEEFKLRVIYIAANLPSPVPEEAEEEEDSSPRSEVMGNEVNRPSVCDLAHTNGGAYREEPSCAEGTSVISKLVGEREYAVGGSQKLQEEMELLRETKSSQQGFSLLFVLLVFMSSVYVGHLMNGIKV